MVVPSIFENCCHVNNFVCLSDPLCLCVSVAVCFTDPDVYVSLCVRVCLSVCGCVCVPV